MGGLSDISGDWRNPHAEHNNGKVIDIGFRNRQGEEMDDNNKLLLREVIRNNQNYQSMPGCEGGRNVEDANGCTRTVRQGNQRVVVDFITDHFHVFFRNLRS